MVRQIQSGGPEGYRRHLACMIVVERASLMPSLKEFFFLTFAEGTRLCDSKQNRSALASVLSCPLLDIAVLSQVLMFGPQSKDFR